ncbi:Hibadh [Symbiodinium sp. CCMP2456]|nr:Hibadh [Symbiodinium sp. CCMP2456]
MLPPELASAGNSPARPSAVSGFGERDAQICIPSEVSPKRPARPARPAWPARAKPRARPREPRELPAAVAPTFCLNSDVKEGFREGRDEGFRDGFREVLASPPRRKLPSRGRLRASVVEPRTTSSDVFVSDLGRADPVPVASMQPSDLPALSLHRGDRGTSFKEEDAADDLRGIVSLDVNVDTPASVTLEIPSKAESSPIDKEEDMLRELQQLAASVQPATESSSDSDIEGTGTPDARLVITQDPRGHGSSAQAPAPAKPSGHGSSAQAPAPAKPIVPTDTQDLLQASSGRRESEDVLDILAQLSEDSLEVEEDEDAEDEEEEEEGEDGEEGEEEEEESEAASATR